MYITSIKFKRALEWFLYSKYNYLLIYASGANKLDYKISREVLTYRQLIDAQTGHLVCFLHFINSEHRQDSIIRANHTDSVEDFMIYHINTEEAQELTHRDLYHGVGLEATYETTRDLCEFFDILQCDLPAFILIHKNKSNTDLLSLTHQYSLFSIKNLEDLHSLLTPIKIINDYQSDITSIRNKITELRKIPDATVIQQHINCISRGIERLQKENIDNLISGRTEVCHAIHSILLSYNKNLDFTDTSFYSFKQLLIKEGLINEFVSQHRDIFNLFKKIDKRIQKWSDKKDDKIELLNKSLKQKQNILMQSRSKEEQIHQLKQKEEDIKNKYKNTINETLLIDNSSEILDAVDNNNSTLPIIIEKTISNYLGQDQVIISIVNGIRDKVHQNAFDIFISCKSEDYVYREQLFHFLSSRGFHPFIASKSLRTVGNDLYGLVISEVIDSCKHMIVYATNLRFVETPYVESEWSRFVNEVYAGRKDGKLISIIPDPRQDAELPIDLRIRQKFPTSDYEAITEFLLD